MREIWPSIAPPMAHDAERNGQKGPMGVTTEAADGMNASPSIKSIRELGAASRARRARVVLLARRCMC